MTKIALSNGRIIDGTGQAPIEPGTLLVADGSLEAVGPGSAVPIPAGYRAIDLQGKSVLPALIDGHMHVSGEPGRLDHMGHINTNLKGVGLLQKCLGRGTGTVAHAAGGVENLLLRDVTQARSGSRPCRERSGPVARGRLRETIELGLLGWGCCCT